LVSTCTLFASIRRLFRMQMACWFTPAGFLTELH
jgi:hypothetical protein